MKEGQNILSSAAAVTAAEGTGVEPSNVSHKGPDPALFQPTPWQLKIDATKAMVFPRVSLRPFSKSGHVSLGGKRDQAHLSRGRIDISH